MSKFSAEYTKLRDIAQKRMKRGLEQGLSQEIHFPTMREIKAGIVDSGMAMRELKRYLSGGSTVTAIKQTGLVPEFRQFPTLPPAPQISDDERRAQKRLQASMYRKRKAIRESLEDGQELNMQEIKARIHYMYELKGWAEKHKREGREPLLDITKLGPKEAAALAAYMSKRYAQGEHTTKYLVDTFVKDYTDIKKAGYKIEDVMRDMDAFMERQKVLNKNAVNMEGITRSESNKYWRDYIGRLKK